jgi:hypothetical protein
MQTLPPLPKGNGNEEKRDQLMIEFSKSANNPRAERPASDEVSADRFSGKYQSTRNSQLSTFGLTFQIYEMHRERGGGYCAILFDALLEFICRVPAPSDD